MIKIIKPGYKKEVECSKCGAVLSYDENEDIKEENLKSLASSAMETFSRKQKFINCPQCRHKIILSTTR